MLWYRRPPLALLYTHILLPYGIPPTQRSAIMNFHSPGLPRNRLVSCTSQSSPTIHSPEYPLVLLQHKVVYCASCSDRGIRQTAVGLYRGSDALGAILSRCLDLINSSQSRGSPSSYSSVFAPNGSRGVVVAEIAGLSDSWSTLAC